MFEQLGLWRNSVLFRQARNVTNLAQLNDQGLLDTKHSIGRFEWIVSKVKCAMIRTGVSLESFSFSTREACSFKRVGASSSKLWTTYVMRWSYPSFLNIKCI
jgi:hypothetical protein